MAANDRIGDPPGVDKTGNIFAAIIENSRVGLT
jgi:hypothetical protein